jgi:hypothetical protein
MSVNPDTVLIELGSARDQGPRPTCLSFSISEIHRAAIALDELLSPESLHRLAATRAKKLIGEGLLFHEAKQGLHTDGQTTELKWPYDEPKALDVGCIFHRADATSLPFDHDIVVATLKSGIPIGLIIDVDLTFFGHASESSLELTPTSQVQGRHAIVICGVRTSFPKFEYLIKKPWGTGWGVKGYAWLTHNHVSGRTPILVD